MPQIIWTNHLKERSVQRGIDPADVDRAIRFPDHVYQSRNTASYQYVKTIGNFDIIVAVRMKGQDWIVASVWKKPAGRADKYRQQSYKKSFIENFVDYFLAGLEVIFRRRSNR